MSCRSTSGGSVSTTLARAVSGLHDKEIQELFHALKREGSDVAGPSELDMSAWRDRQHQLLSRMERMGQSKKDTLRNKLFRSRSEPIPDPATFYAWSRIEARARQEAVIRSIEGAVDLEPAGSQADQYELGEDGRPTRVWYASYGSNLNRARFMAYIEGGQPPGSRRTYEGCTDKTAPEEDIPIRFPGRAHFALTSSVWRGGIAFADGAKDAQGLGRAYSISIDQFDEVVAAENGLDVKDAAPVPLEEALMTGRSVTGGGPYETILHIGDYQGAPVLTFTAPFSTRDALTHEGSVTRGKVRLPVRTNKPSAAYVRMIGSGLHETFGMNEVQQADYLRGCPGGDRWSRQDLVKALRGEDEPAEPASGAGTRQPNASVPDGKGQRHTPTMPQFSEADRRLLRETMDEHPSLFSQAGLGPGGDLHSRSTSGSGRRKRTKGGKSGKGRATDLIQCSACKGTHKYGSQNHRTCVLRHQSDRTLTTATMPESMLGSRPGSPVESVSTDDTPRATGQFTLDDYQQNRPAASNEAGEPVSLRVPPRKDNGQFYSGVKRYETIDEQRVGVRKWLESLNEAELKAERINAAVADLKAKRDFLKDARAHHTEIDEVEAELDAIKGDVEEMQDAVEELRAKVKKAKEQNPTTFYGSPSRYSRENWVKLARQVVGWRKRARETVQQAERDLEAAKRSNDETRIRTEERHLRRAVDMQMEMEARLAEVQRNVQKAKSNKNSSKKDKDDEDDD